MIKLFPPDKINGAVPSPRNVLSPTGALDPLPVADRIFFGIGHQASAETSATDYALNASAIPSSGSSQDMEAAVDGNIHSLHHLSRIRQAMKGHQKAEREVWTAAAERQAGRRGIKSGRNPHKHRANKTLIINADF